MTIFMKKAKHFLGGSFIKAAHQKVNPDEIINFGAHSNSALAPGLTICAIRSVLRGVEHERLFASPVHNTD